MDLYEHFFLLFCLLFSLILEEAMHHPRLLDMPGATTEAGGTMLERLGHLAGHLREDRRDGIGSSSGKRKASLISVGTGHQLIEAEGTILERVGDLIGLLREDHRDGIGSSSGQMKVSLISVGTGHQLIEAEGMILERVGDLVGLLREDRRDGIGTSLGQKKASLILDRTDHQQHLRYANLLEVKCTCNAHMW